MFRRFMARIWCRISFGHYYSSACLHREHGECRRVCRWCGDECACACHGNGLPVIATGVTYP